MVKRKTHPPYDCENCGKYHTAWSYANRQNVRADGRVEWICEHGIGHTKSIPNHIKKADRRFWFIHGCDGCCSK